ncbi:orotate phosphoribosyltransferase [Thermodesulfobacteriota bacterium]
MEEYKKRLANTLAETGALLFDRKLVLKDGRPTPYFVNLAMFKTGRLALEMGTFFAGMMVSKGLVEETDIIIGPSYKGSAIALSTAVALYKDHGFDLLYDYDRKEAKTHGEASAGKTIFVNQTLFDGSRLFVVDDVATSMGTKYELLEKIEEEGRSRGMNFNVIGIGICIDREQTTAVYDAEGKVIEGVKGENATKDFSKKTKTPVHSVAGIREVVDYLYKEGVDVTIRGKRMPIDDTTLEQFLKYLEIYGVV